MAWGYKLNQNEGVVKYACTDVTETADYYRNGKRVSSYHDSHTEPKNYQFHSATPDNTGGSDVKYKLVIKLSWSWYEDVELYGNVDTSVTFNYTVTGSNGCSTPSRAAVAPAC